MKTSVAVGLILSVALVACTAQQQNESQAKVQQAYSAAPGAVKNAYLTAAVASKLAVVDLDASTNVHTSVDNGVVTLSGQARDAAERNLYVRTARTVGGVVSVRDMLSINPHLKGLSEQVTDAALQTRVAAAIATQAGVNVFHVQTSVHGGMVTLRGFVPSRSVDRTVLQTVRSISGVRAVVNEIVVQK